MARRRRTPEQIIRALAEGQKLLADGASVAEVCRRLEIAESTWARWLNQYGGMTVMAPPSGTSRRSSRQPTMCDSSTS